MRVYDDFRCPWGCGPADHDCPLRQTMAAEGKAEAPGAYHIYDDPLPAGKGAGARRGLLQRLEVGQSFLVPSRDVTLNALVSQCSYWSNKLRSTFRAAELDNGDYKVTRLE